MLYSFTLAIFLISHELIVIIYNFCLSFPFALLCSIDPFGCFIDLPIFMIYTLVLITFENSV